MKTEESNEKSMSFTNLYDFYLDETKQPICRVQCGPKTLHAILDYYLNNLDSEGFHSVGSVTIKRVIEEN